jgi:hypothetical protein
LPNARTGAKSVSVLNSPTKLFAVFGGVKVSGPRRQIEEWGNESWIFKRKDISSSSWIKLAQNFAKKEK